MKTEKGKASVETFKKYDLQCVNTQREIRNLACSVVSAIVTEKDKVTYRYIHEVLEKAKEVAEDVIITE